MDLECSEESSDISSVPVVYTGKEIGFCKFCFRVNIPGFTNLGSNLSYNPFLLGHCPGGLLSLVENMRYFVEYCKLTYGPDLGNLGQSNYLGHKTKS